MKRKTLYISAALALAFALAGCTKEDTADGGRLPAGEYPVVIQATGLSVEAMPQTAASRATVDGDWDGVTSVALRIGGEVKAYDVTADAADNTRATLSRENDPFWWTSREDITVSAWWPYDADNIAQMPDVVVLEDQSTLAAFQGSDFISAENRTVEFDNPTLEFFHRTARVAVKLTAGDGFSDSDIGGATVRLVSLSAANGNPDAVKAWFDKGGNSHEALTAPQTVAADKPFIEVNIGGDTFYFLPQNDVVLEAGNRHIYTIRVSASGLTLEGSSIGGWDEGNGESGAAEDLGYSISADGRTYTVYNAKGLLAWNEAARNDLSLNCTLAADITLPAVAEGESNWTPMGNYDNQYTGTFDGGGHTITGLTVDLPNQSRVGLIGYLGSGGKVQNLTLAGVEINGRGFVGGVAGGNSGTVTGCAVSGKVSGNSLYIGGVVGYNANYSTVTGCYAAGDVSGDDYVGGVVGCNTGTVTACYATGDVSGTYYVGGVVGGNSGTVTSCYATGDVSGNMDIGGVVGYNANYGTVTGCYATGDVSGNMYIGGVVGSNTGTVTACYHANGTVSGPAGTTGGVAGRNFKGSMSGGGIITACFWGSNGQTQGIGENQAGTTGETMLVDGTTVTWQKAVDAMNTALQSAGSEWRYELTGELPTLKKEE